MSVLDSGVTTCRALAPATTPAQHLAAPRPRFQEGLSPIRMAPLAAPGAPASRPPPAAQPDPPAQSAPAAHLAPMAHAPQAPHGSAAGREPGSAEAPQLERSSSRREATAGKQEQDSVPRLTGRDGSKGRVRDAEGHQKAVVYSLGGPPGSPHHTAVPPSSAGQQAKSAAHHYMGPGHGSESSSQTPGFSENQCHASPANLKHKAGLSIAQQAVLRCREKQLALGEPHQDLQVRRQQLEDACSGSSSKQEAMSPSQANGMSRGRMMHAHLAPTQPRQHESEHRGSDSSAQDTQELHPSQKPRGDSERPLHAGAKRGTQAPGIPPRSPKQDIAGAQKPACSGITSPSSDSRQPERHQRPALAPLSSPQTHRRPSTEQEAAYQPRSSVGPGSHQPQQPSSAAVERSPLKQLQSKAAVAPVAHVRAP